MSTLYGHAFAVNRYQKYTGTVHFMYHSDYFDTQIERAYDAENKPKALYRARIKDDAFCVGESLTNIKYTVKLYKSEGPEYFKEAKI